MNRAFKTACLVVALLVAAGLLLMILLPGSSSQSGGDEPETVTVNLVYAYQNSLWNSCVEEVIRRFEADNPHIDIVYEIRYEDEVYEDMLNKLAARDELGDVVQIKEPYSYAESGLLAPLPDELTQQVATCCRLDGRTYAVAALGATTGVVYNKALFARYGLSVPETYDQFLSLCADLKSKGVDPLGVGGNDLWHFEYWLNHFLRSDVLSAQPDFLALCSAGEKDWNDPLITKMLTHFNELFRRGYVNEAWPSTPDGAMAYHMAEGEVAMVFSGPWLISSILALDPEAELGWFYVPNEDGLVVAGDSVDVFWAVTESCQRDEARYEAALAFLTYFYSSGVYEEVYTSMAGFSTLADQSRNQYPSAGVLNEVLSDREAADVRYTAYVGDENTPRGFEKELLSLLSRMCAGELTVEETQALANEAWVRCLSQEAAYEK